LQSGDRKSCTRWGRRYRQRGAEFGGRNSRRNSADFGNAWAGSVGRDDLAGIADIALESAVTTTRISKTASPP